MKKILAVFDVSSMSESTLGYAISFSRSTGAHLAGLFLDESIFHPYNAKDNRKTKNPENTKKITKSGEKKAAQAKNIFQKKCEQAEIQFSILQDERMTLRQLKSESMYCDLMVIDQNETFNNVKETPPTHFIKDLLGDIQCPALVVPSLYTPVEKLVLLYDGGPAALYAIKMFSYVLGNPQNLPVKVLTVKEKKKTAFFMPDNKKIREFTKRHFPKATFVVAKGSAEEEISSYLSHLPRNQLAVLGAYQRSEISRWFKVSMADVLMKQLEMPLFIAHNNM